VHFEGDDNRVDHSSFRGKTTAGPVIANRPGARRNQVDRCHFKDIAFRAQNGREVIQIMGYGMNEELGVTAPSSPRAQPVRGSPRRGGGDHLDQGATATSSASLRSGRPRAASPTAVGNFNVIEGNFILGEGEPRSYGIRVTGQYHRWSTTRWSGVAGRGPAAGDRRVHRRPLTPDWQPLLRAGTPLGPRAPVCAGQARSVRPQPLHRLRWSAIEVGSAYKAGWPRGQQVLLPENNHLVENQIRQSESAPAPPRPDYHRWIASASSPTRSRATAPTQAAPGRIPGPAPASPARDVGPRWRRLALSGDRDRP
jgi:poly(beta-D-mannuronate) lyase